VQRQKQQDGSVMRFSFGYGQAQYELIKVNNLGSEARG
jgi:hypothetical protein